jgi:hypothetical protein
LPAGNPSRVHESVGEVRCPSSGTPGEG